MSSGHNNSINYPKTFIVLCLEGTGVFTQRNMWDIVESFHAFIWKISILRPVSVNTNTHATVLLEFLWGDFIYLQQLISIASPPNHPWASQKTTVIHWNKGSSRSPCFHHYIYYLGEIIMEFLPKGKLLKINNKINNNLLRWNILVYWVVWEK